MVFERNELFNNKSIDEVLRLYRLAGIPNVSTADLLRRINILCGFDIVNDWNKLGYSDIEFTALFDASNGNAAHLQELLDIPGKRRFVAYIIDELIEMAIEAKQHEITAMLLDYKQKNGLYSKTIEERLKL